VSGGAMGIGVLLQDAGQQSCRGTRTGPEQIGLLVVVSPWQSVVGTTTARDGPCQLRVSVVATRGAKRVSGSMQRRRLRR
jgi:hypothetical protein